MVFLVDKKRKVYKTVGGAEENWVRPPQKTWNYDFPDEDWIKASEQEKKSIRCWLPKKYWHLDVKA